MVQVVQVVITIPLLVVVVLLLGEADVVFADLVENVFSGFEFADAFGMSFVFVGALFGTYAWLSNFVILKIGVFLKLLLTILLQQFV